MTLTEYQNLQMRTAPHLEGNPLMCDAALGLAGEAGEVVDIIKKHIYHDHPLDREHLAEEIGDVLWYVSLMSYSCGVPLNKIAEGNIAKLKKRYPNGFNAEDSIHRVI